MAYQQLDTAFAQEAADYLQDNAPDVYAGIKSAVNEGKTPADIRRHVAALIGPDRSAMAKRVELAAMYVESVSK